MFSETWLLAQLLSLERDLLLHVHCSDDVQVLFSSLVMCLAYRYSNEQELLLLENGKSICHPNPEERTKKR